MNRILGGDYSGRHEAVEMKKEKKRSSSQREIRGRVKRGGNDLEDKVADLAGE